MQIIDVPSPNFDERPAGVMISLVVIHSISLPPGVFGNGRVIDFFCNRLPVKEHPFFREVSGLKVSAHYFIDRSGTIFRFVPENKRAWHAGVSRFAGRDNCNDFSLGIELEGDDIHPFANLQYESLNLLLKDIYHRHPRVNRGLVVGHADISPGRKTDPGPFFQWERVAK
jgi:AmpD protein